MLAILTFAVTVGYLPFAADSTTSGRWFAIAAITPLLLWRGPVRASPGHWLGAAFVVWCIASFWWSARPVTSLESLRQLLLLAGVFCLGSQERDIRPCFVGLVAGLLVNDGFVIAQLLGYKPVATIGTNRPVGLFLNHSFMAELAMAAGVAATAMRSRLLLVPSLVALLPTFSAGPIGIFAILSTWSLTRRNALVVLAAFIGLVTVGTYYYFDPRGEHGSFASYLNRQDFWQIAMSNLTWRGYGIGTTPELMPMMEHVHCEFIEWWFEVGAGVLFLVGMVVYALADRSADHSKGITRLALSALVLDSFLWFPLHVPATAYLFALLAGHLCGYRGVIEPAEPVRGDWRWLMVAREWGARRNPIPVVSSLRASLPVRPTPTTGA